MHRTYTDYYYSVQYYLHITRYKLLVVVHKTTTSTCFETAIQQSRMVQLMPLVESVVMAEQQALSSRVLEKWILSGLLCAMYAVSPVLYVIEPLSRIVDNFGHAPRPGLPEITKCWF